MPCGALKRVFHSRNGSHTTAWFLHRVSFVRRLQANRDLQGFDGFSGSFSGTVTFGLRLRTGRLNDLSTGLLNDLSTVMVTHVLVLKG